MPSETQQILAYETRIANVADPLAGSYYVEALTDKMEEEIKKIIAEIDERGGMMEAQRLGWADEVINSEALKIQKQIESGERIVVGVNRFISDGSQEKEIPVHEVPEELVASHINRLVKFKAQRNMDILKPALLKLRREAERKTNNLFSSTMEAIEAGASLGEINGNIRLGFGYSYDDLEAIPSPF